MNPSEMTTETPRTTRTRMETAHLLCDSDDFEDVISMLKKEGEELELELTASQAEVEGLRKLIEQLFDATEPACEETCKCTWRLLKRAYSQNTKIMTNNSTY